MDSYGTAPTPTRPFVSQLPKTPASKLKVAELKEALESCPAHFAERAEMEAAQEIYLYLLREGYLDSE